MNFLNPEYHGLTSDELLLIDQICGRYERGRLHGEPAHIEDMVADAPASIRGVLELELIRIELEIAESWHETPKLADFIRRFPQSADAIRAEWENRRAANSLLIPGRPNAHERKTQDQKDLETPAEGQIDSEPERNDTHNSSVDVPERFRIMRRIAEGGIGTVYAALDGDLQREVALKELKGSLVRNSSVINRFLIEATVTSHLEHPNIVPIYAVGRRADGRHFYAMRLIRGQSMHAAIGQLHRQFSGDSLSFRRTPEARDLLLRFIAVCRAIGFAHSRGVIHRDLKPANIMVGDFGETLIVDWGLARRRVSDQPQKAVRDHSLYEGASEVQSHDKSFDTRMAQQEAATRGASPSHYDAALISDIEGDVDSEDCRTREGTIVGTPGFMSPEQANGQVEAVDETSDIYSLGATLFCLLTNAVPHQHTGFGFPSAVLTRGAKKMTPDEGAVEETVISVADGKRSTTVHSPRKIIAEIPFALDAICRRAMAFRQADRYRSPEDMARDLEAWLADEPVSVLAESRLRKTRRWLRQRPRLAGAMLGSVAIATMAMAITLQILSGKNKDLIEANHREHEATEKAEQQGQVAAANAKDAEQQRQRIQEILHSFITDVEQGLKNVPGSSMVRKRVLTQVLKQLSVVSDSMRGNADASSNSAMALTDLGDLFAQFGINDVSGTFRFGKLESASPSDAAMELYDEAMQVIERQLAEGGDHPKALLQKSSIQYKQASLLRQIGKTAEAMALISSCATATSASAEANPTSLEWALAAVVACDMIGQIHLQNGELELAESQFLAADKVLMPFRQKTTLDEDVLWRVGMLAQRLGDIAAKRGDLEKAEKHYLEDVSCAEQLATTNRENVQSQRALSLSIDRLGNMRAARGDLEKALEFYLKSRGIRKEIRDADPTDQKSLHELFVSCMKTGDTRMMMGKVGEAKTDFASASETADRMAAADPKSTMARRFQSFSAEMLADIAIKENDLDNALKYAARSLDVSRELADLDPSDGQAQQDVLLCHSKVAKVHQARNDFPAAVAQFRLAEAIAYATLQKNPSLESKSSVIFVQAKIGETFLKADDPAQAEPVLRSAIELLESIPVENRSDVTLRRRMVNLPTLRADALIRLERPEEARVLLEQAKTLANDMIQKNERAEQLKLDLVDIESLLSSITADAAK